MSGRVLAEYPACQGGDGYRVPEAAGSCVALARAPRAADLLIRYVADSLRGRIGAPQAGRITSAADTNSG